MPTPKVEAEYFYRDEAGTILHKKTRYTPKTFKQSRPDPDEPGRWIYDLTDVRKVLYRLPDLKGQKAILMCYSPDTEVLTRQGWVAFPDLVTENEIAQYDNGTVSFVLPTAHQHFLYDGPFVAVKSDWCDLLVTPDHRMLTRCQKGKWGVRRAEDMTQGSIIPTCGECRSEGISPTEDQARLIASYLGDGRRERGRRRSWNAKKPRKIKRLHVLLTKLGIPFRSAPIESAQGWTQTVIWSTDAEWLEQFAVDRRLSWASLDWSLASRRAFLDELRHWDGDSVGTHGHRFFTAKRDEAEIVSAMAAVSGMGVAIRTDIRPSRPDQQPQYILNISARRERSVSKKPSTVQNLFGEVFCVSVPSGFILVRRNGKVVVSGNCEGEKDVEAAWALGVPATCTPDGAGKWIPEYGEQLKAQGVERVAVIPDNDAPGSAHAILVCIGLCAAGIDTRLVQLPGLDPHGDLSDYLQTHTKADLLALVKAAVAYVPVIEMVPARRFQSMGEQRYCLTLNGIVLEANRLRRSSQELHGELLVRVNGEFPNARTFGDGILQVGDMNFSSTTTRTSRAKLLAERAGEKSVDWYGILEEFITEVLAAERRGKPAEPLADSEAEEENTDAWMVDQFPLLRQLPQVVFGSSASGKSYFAMWLAGMLAKDGINVLYADWEFSQSEHKKRLQRLFQPMPKNLLYIRCDHSLKQETDHLIDVIQKHRIQYIVCDSIGFACDGPAENQEGAAGYFRYLRQLKVGSLNISHIPKQSDDNREAQVFGSVFFTNGARSIWFIDRARENAPGEIRFGLYHRKNNVGALLQPKGFKLVFRGDVTSVEAINLKDVEELAAGFPLLDRMRELLVSGPLSVKSIAEELSTTVTNVRGVLSRHRSQFVKVGSKISVSSGRVDDNSEGVAEF